MKKEKAQFKAVDIFLIIMMILPIAAAIVLKILFTPKADGIEIAGALIFTTVKLPFWDLPITESQVNSLAVVISLFWLCLYLTHGITAKGKSKRQILAEMIVEKTDSLIKTNMGDYFKGFSPFIAAIMGLSGFSSLISLLGLYTPTSDINIVAGWAILVFILITYYKSKCGPVKYLKSFGEPIALLTPLNIISEVATPASMAFRHYGNVLSGSVISVLIAAALEYLSAAVLSFLPGVLGTFPLFRIGIPAVFSIYFDLFSGLLQAFIFAMLTMLYVSGAFPAEDYFKKIAAKKAKNKKSEEK